jgi:hypothetical protein
VTDPFYRKILEALAGPLDPQRFERCMGDLLRRDFPGLVPVPGGNDAGTDGLIPDGEGEPFPLICTTGEDVIGNLTKSLDSYLRSGQPSRKAAIATTQSLTPEKRRNLFARAREKGFTLMQVLDRPALADRLYGNSRWCKELLELSGVPSVLSMVPATRRPLIEIEPVGREADIAWLQETRGDRVLSGEPGAGKTFLLYHLMRRGWPGLFLAPGPLDLGALALALQENRPETVIVDDAYVDPERLVELVRLRREKELAFQILATTWKGGEREVIGALGGLPADRVRRMELLTREEILTVLRNVGVTEDEDRLMGHLVDQAANKPGLAVTIATLWLQGSWQEVVEGTVLSRTLTNFFARYLGEQSTNVLAAFSLGGSRGMPQEVVREFLGLNRPEIRRILGGLLAGGTLFEAGEETLVVRPPVLRSPLLRSVFFPDEGGGLSYRELLDQAPSRAKSVLALIEAKARGAGISDKELQELVREVNALEVWQTFPWLSEENARWVLQTYPGDVLQVVSGALDRIPQEAIPRVLERAEELSRAGERADRAMDVLLAWSRELLGDPSREVQRRWELAWAVRRFLLAGGEPGIGAYGLSLALSPVRKASSLDPGIGKTVKMQSGLLPLGSLGEIAAIWDEVRGAIRTIDRTTWLHLSTTLSTWIDPRHAVFSVEVPAELLQAMNGFAVRVLRDLVPMAEGSPGLASALSRLAKKLKVDLSILEDPLFLLLFPDLSGEPDEWREQKARGENSVRELATKWASIPAPEIAQKILFYQREAHRIGDSSIDNLPLLCRTLAEKAVEPSSWLAAFLKAGLPELLAAPFLERVVKDQAEDWQEILYRSLTSQLAWTATALVLTLADPPDALLDEALRTAERFPMLVESLCLRQEAPLPTLRALLRSSDLAVSCSAIVGEWVSEPEGQVREEARTEWREAFLRWDGDKESSGTQYWLGVILRTESDLAYHWLKLRLRDEDPAFSLVGDSPVARAAGALDREQRNKFLTEIQGPTELLFSLIPLLIQRDLELYRNLLQRMDLADYHLLPLEGALDQEWEALAVAALEAGFAPRDVASAIYPRSYTFAGSGREHWSEWDRAFARLESHSRRDLREVGRHGRERAQEGLKEAEERERSFALYGHARRS